jgi:ABC-type antimicrobial peptide transport system permease subunit
MVSTAVITGSLVVGDSMEQLVYTSTFKNLGEVDQVLKGKDFFDYRYFQALATEPKVDDETDGLAPIILIKCSVESRSSGYRENDAQLIGMDQNILSLGSFKSHETGDKLTSQDLKLGKNEIIINEKLASKLNIEINDELDLIIPNPAFRLDTVFSESFGLNAIERVVRIKQIVEHDNLGSLQMDGRTQDTGNIFMNLTQVQNILGIDNKINTILISNNGDKYTGFENDDRVAEVIYNSLDNNIGYSDLGYELNISGSDYLRITNKDVFFDSEIYDLLKLSVSEPELDFQVSPVLTYFVNYISLERTEKIVNYSLVTGLDLVEDANFGDFEWLSTDSGNNTITHLDPDEIILLNWTADQLGAEVGDVLTMEYMALDRLYNIYNTTHNFTIKYIIGLSGKASDEFLMPAFPGLEGKVDCVNWEPPFPIDLNRISKDDRDFWFKNSGTPKAYISLNNAQEVWSNNLGSLTMIKVSSSSNTGENGLLNLKNEVENYLNNSIDHSFAGFIIDDVKSDSLDTTEGMTIFPMMFLAFGSAIIIAGMALIVVIFLTLADARKYEFGMLRSVGLKRSNVIRAHMVEGLIYGISAGILGIFFGLFLGWILVAALNTIWSGAVENFSVPFHFKPISLFYGFIAGLVITIITIYFTAKHNVKAGVTSLLYDLPAPEKSTKKTMLRLGYFLIILSLILLIFIAPLTEFMDLDLSYDYLSFIGLPLLLIGLILTLSYSAKTKKKRTTWLKYSSVISTIGFIIAIIFFSTLFDIPSVDFFFISGLYLLLFFIILTIVFFDSISNGILHISKINKKSSPVVQYSLKNPTRKLNRLALTISIFTLVIFLLVALSINIAIQEESVNAISYHERGGYDVLGETSIPIEIDLDNRDERLENDIDEPIFEDITITEIKLVGPPGGTCSNMNVRYPPRLLGVGSEFIQKNSFVFMDSLSGEEDDRKIWHELDQSSDENDGKIPIVVDYNTLVWIYNGGLGDIFEVTAEDGTIVKLEVIGIIENTIFGGTFIMSESNIDILYPESAAYQYLLIKIDNDLDSTPEQVALELEQNLDQYGLDAQAIRQLILENREYERSFMSLFQAFLGLGLILGIIGLGVVMARNVIERRFEIGLLRTIGFTKSMILKSFILELSFIALLASLIGIFVGILSSWFAFGLWTGDEYKFVLPWLDLVILVVIIYIITILSSIFPAYRAAKIPPSEALRKVG